MKPILLIGEAMGENEEKISRGFVGATGAELLKMLDDAQVISLSSSDHDYIRKYWRTQDPWCLDAVWEMHPEVRRTNVFQQHPPGNDLSWFCGPREEGIPGYPALLAKRPVFRYWRGGYVRKEFQYELDRLGDEILASDPNLLVCLGNSALWAMAGRTGITKLRGTTCVSSHTVSGYKCLLTYHPSAVTRQWELRPTTVIDLAKARYENQYIEVRRPPVEIWIAPDLQDIQTFISNYITNGCDLLSVDIETSGNQITTVGWATGPSLALVIPIHDDRTKAGSYWATKELELQCWELIRQVLENPEIPKLFQNGVYDIAFLWRSVGIGVRGALHDTMLLHHALQPEALKGLGYLGSIYTNHGPWKSEHKESTIKRDA